MHHNVRRYVALVRQLADGGARCPVSNAGRSGCFCTLGAVQGYDGYYFVLALAKTVTPGGNPRREPGRPAPPLIVYHFDQKILAVQKQIAYTDLLATVSFLVYLFDLLFKGRNIFCNSSP